MKLFIVNTFFMILCLLSCEVKSFPAKKNDGYKPMMVTHSALQFMQKYGYLDEGQPGFEAQYTDDSIREAVINIQKYGAINQTGILDEETIKLMSKKRCGVKDVITNSKRRKRYAIMATGWKKREITYFISNWSPQIGEATVAKEIKRGLQVWAGYGNLTFIRTNNPHADIIIDFSVGYHGDPFPFDGPGNVLAHAFFPYSSRYGGHVHFDNDEKWTTTYQEDENANTDFFSVAVHEIGHALGLGHSAVPSSIMFPYYRGYESSTQLDYDDVMAMYQLYIRSPIESDSKLHLEDNEGESTTRREDVEQATETEMPPIQETTAVNTNDVTYEGDFENVDDHKKHDEKYNRNDEKDPVDICDGKYDAVSVLRRELFVFKDEFVWRFKTRGQLEEEYPIKIHQQFPHLPSTIKKIDAVFEKPDGTIAIFSGRNHWIHHDDRIVGPFSLSSYEISDSVSSLDAAFVWNKNEMTYLFKGNQFWRYNETSQRLDADYPKNITRWRGIPSDIDAVIIWKDESTYFFKGLLYWRFDNTLIKADRHYPLPATPYWFGCPESYEAFRQLPKEILTIGYMPH